MLKVVILLSAILTQIYLDEPPEMDSIPLTFPDSQAELVYENNRAIISVSYYEFLGRLSIAFYSRTEIIDLIKYRFMNDNRLYIKGLDVETVDENGKLILGPRDPNDLIINDSIILKYKRKDGSSFRMVSRQLNDKIELILEELLCLGQAKVYDKVEEKYVQWISSRDVIGQENKIVFRGYFFPNDELFLRRLRFIIPNKHGM